MIQMNSSRTKLEKMGKQVCKYKRERALTIVERVCKGMRGESGLKRETLELWRRGREKGREEVVVVDMVTTVTPTGYGYTQLGY